MSQTDHAPETFSATGTVGLDHILNGGFTPNRLYLIEGDPGAGKTTLAICYLLEGAKHGEPGMYLTLSESREEIDAVARSHGWSLDAINTVELVASEDALTPDSQYTMYHPAETELAETTKSILEAVERFKPRRVVIDSLSELRLLAQTRSATAGRFWPSSSSSPGGSVPCCCWTTAAPRTTTSRCAASRTGC